VTCYIFSNIFIEFNIRALLTYTYIYFSKTYHGRKMSERSCSNEM